MTETRDDRIRARAYDLWQSDGGKTGDDWAYWLQAEREISEQEATLGGSTPANDAPVATPAKDPIKKASPKKAPASKAATAAKARKPEKAPAAKPTAKARTKAAPVAPAPDKR